MIRAIERARGCLACPDCGSSVAFDGAAARCDACSRSFSVRDGALDLLPTSHSAHVDGASADPQWRRWREAIDGLAKWRERRAAKATGDSLPSDGVHDLDLYELLEHANTDGVVIDVGARGGERAALLSASAAYVGVDPVPQTPSEALDSRGVLVRGIAERLPVRSGAAQCVLCLSSFDYFVDADAAVDEFARVLAPGGTLALSVSVVPDAVARARGAASRFARGALGLAAARELGVVSAVALAYTGVIRRDREHTRYHSQDDVVRTLERVFTIEWVRALHQRASTILFVTARVRSVSV